jgi:plastocyanin
MLRAALVAICCITVFPAAVFAAEKTHEVRIEGIKFVPERLEVAAGDMVVWTNKDLVPHTVTASQAKVESGEIAPNKSWRFVAKRKGEMAYICRLHPVMKAVLVVK